MHIVIILLTPHPLKLYYEVKCACVIQTDKLKIEFKRYLGQNYNV